MGRYIFSNYELVIVVVYFDYYVNLWYNKDVTKISFFIKRRKRHDKKSAKDGTCKTGIIFRSNPSNNNPIRFVSQFPEQGNS